MSGSMPRLVPFLAVAHCQPVFSLSVQQRWRLPSSFPCIIPHHLTQIARFSTESKPEVSYTEMSSPNNGIGVINITRPRQKNAINFGLMEKDIVDDVYHNELIGCVIIRSAVEGIFCAGADLKERALLPEVEYKRWSLTIRALFTYLSRAPAISIAAIDGPALGGGLELALACDLRVAASDARLAFPETGLAIIPGAGGTQRLTRLVGASVAKELILTGKSLTGEEARHIGLVNRSVSRPGSVFEAALNLATSVTDNGVENVRRVKRSMVDDGLI